jgi:hypothetical protein
MERMIIDVTAEPIAVANPIENNINFHFLVNSHTFLSRIFLHFGYLYHLLIQTLN